MIELFIFQTAYVVIKAALNVFYVSLTTLITALQLHVCFHMQPATSFLCAITLKPFFNQPSVRNQALLSKFVMSGALWVQ